MIVLGISAFYHDSAAAIVRDGEVLAAAQEERFSRKKGDSSFPSGATEYCLDAADVNLDQVDFIAFYDKPLLTFDRLLETYVAFAPRGLRSFVRSMPVWLKQKLFAKTGLIDHLNALNRGKVEGDRVLFGHHHHSHAASAFYPSPFENAAVLILDGVGEWATTSLGRGRGAKLELLQEIRFPHSLGMLYTAFTYHLGFTVNQDEYKVMGLAPYGEPRYVKQIYDHLIDVKPDGSFHLDLQYFDYCVGLTMTNARFSDLFGGRPPRTPEDPLTQEDMDLARSVQVVTEEVVLRLCDTLHKLTGESNLCLAGGVALNCVANGRVLREGPFDAIWLQPAAGDAGGALGVALAVAHAKGIPRTEDVGQRDGMSGAYLGPAYDNHEILAELEGFGAVYRELDDAALFESVVDALTTAKVVGWFQGRMEFGPRALGNRSILADARSPAIQRMLNLKIKFRESFRPFAPVVLLEQVSRYFELEDESPYMQLVARVRSDRCRELTADEKRSRGLDMLGVVRSDIPAVTHVDESARIQTVAGDTNPRLRRLLEAFAERTDFAVLVNTSFNVRNEPIVRTPADAYRCFMATEMDVLVLGNAILYKVEQ